MKKVHKSDITDYADRMAAENIACSRIDHFMRNTM